MSFRQPTQLTIQAFHFRGDAFSFPVESRLPSGRAGEQLILTPSVGYLLTTSVNPKSQPQQTLTYVLQADGSCLAQATVTVLADGPSLINGTVTLHEPLGERTVLRITIEPQLFLDSPALTFVQSEPGEPVTALLKISQQGANTPVFLSTDKPNRFSLAVGNKPTVFTPTLTFTPAFAGTYVHIQYTPSEFGGHRARLTAKTRYTTQTVSLQGRVDWQLIRRRLPTWSDWRRAWETPIRPPATTRVRKAVMLTLLLLSALAYVGYLYRYPPGPDLHQAQNKVGTTVTLPDTASVPDYIRLAAMPDESSTNPPVTTGRMDTKNGGNRAPKVQKHPYRLQVVNMPMLRGPSVLGSSTKTRSRVPSDPRILPQTQVKLAKSAEESELEKELNQQKNRKH